MVTSKRSPMKSTIVTTSIASQHTAGARYQIYQQTRSGAYVGGLKTDSATDAIRAFLNECPAFEGGELRLWDHREQHLSAWVRWIPRVAGASESVRVREDVFQDRVLALLARLIQPQENLRETFKHGVRLGA